MTKGLKVYWTIIDIDKHLWKCRHCGRVYKVESDFRKKGFYHCPGCGNTIYTLYPETVCMFPNRYPNGKCRKEV